MFPFIFTVPQGLGQCCLHLELITVSEQCDWYSRNVPGEFEVLDVSSQKEFSERQSDW